MVRFNTKNAPAGILLRVASRTPLAEFWVEPRRLRCAEQLFAMQMSTTKPALEQIAVKTTFSIKVIGVGGAGCNALAHMAGECLDGVAYAALNTDASVLARSPVP